MCAPSPSTRSAIAASSGPRSVWIAPAKIQGCRLEMTRSLPRFNTSLLRRSGANSSLTIDAVIIPAMSTARVRTFHTQCQEEVYRQVKTYLDELVDEHSDD